MKAPLIHFALTALLPAALNMSAPVSAGSIAVPICTGDGLVHTVQVPIDGGQQLPGKDPGNCCAKGCHSGSSRKRGGRNFAPAQ